MPLPQAYHDQFEEADGYLDFASIGPPSHLVRERVHAAMDVVAAGGGRMIEHAIALYEDARAATGEFISGDSRNVTFIPATSDGLFQIAFGLHRGNVVVASHEFPANTYPWQRAAQRGGPEVRFVDCPNSVVDPNAVREAVDRDTVAVAVSLVDFATGHRPRLGPLRELAPDALLVVDAIQGFGAIPVTLDECDVIVAGGQKWLRSGWGSGMLAVGDRGLDRLESHLTGWYGVEDFLVFDQEFHRPRPDAEQFQEGSPPIFGGVAVQAAIEVIELAGIDAVHEAVIDRVCEIEDVVRSNGGETLAPWQSNDERAGILNWRLPSEPATETWERLMAAGVICVERIPGWIRVAPHASTSDQTVAMLADAL